MLAVVAVLALGGAALALRLEPSAATDTLVARASETLQGHRALQAATSATTPCVVLVRGDLQRTVLTRRPRPPDQARGLPRRATCREKGARGRAPPRACRRELAELKPAKVGLRPGHVRQHRGQPDHRRARRGREQAPAAGEQAAPTAARKAVGASAATPRRSRSGSPQGGQRRASARSSRRRLQLALRYGLTGLPSLDNPELRLHARVRHARERGRAEAALRLPVPELQERRADPGAPATGPDRRRARRGDRADRAGDRARSRSSRSAARATSSPACRWWSRASPTRCAARSSCCSAPRCC